MKRWFIGTRVGARFPARIGAPHALFVSLVVLAVLLWPLHANAESQAGPSAVRASVDFRIVVPAIVRVIDFVQPNQLRITADDIARGFVDPVASSSVTLTTNSRVGFQLTANYDQQLLSGIEVRAANHLLIATSGSGSMHMASGYAIDRNIPIGYRLHLAPGVRPGSYRWPVALQLSPGST